MKTLKRYIDEAFRINKDTKLKQEYNYHPKTKRELKELIIKLIKERGKDADLNDIDVSGITNINDLFNGLDVHNIDISEWDVSNVKDMDSVFWGCKNFNCDLSSWDVSNVVDMKWMFLGCYKFNCDLSKWDVSKTEYMNRMFYECDSLENKPDWYKE